MNRRPVLVDPVDLELLGALEREPTVVAACRQLGISRDRGVYRLARLSRVAGGPVVLSSRGGRFRGQSHLTSRGHRLLRLGTERMALGPVLPGARFRIPTLRGIFHGRPEPAVDIGQGLHIVVAFRAREGEPVVVGVDPESVTVARHPFPSSARNRLNGRVEKIRRVSPTTRFVEVRVGRHQLWAAVTPRSIENLDIRPGRTVVLHIKATAMRWLTPGATRGSLPR
jgi:molybdopterin-binding protein/molybdate transport repressor ModE-like protein